jgi:hypothetical protein
MVDGFTHHLQRLAVLGTPDRSIRDEFGRGLARAKALA